VNQGYARRDQSAEAKRTEWKKYQWNERTDFGWRLKALKHYLLADLDGVVLKVGEAIAALQENRMGPVIASGEAISTKAGVCESTFWGHCRPALEGLGFMRTVERGGGRMPGGNGRANVYMSPDQGIAEDPPRQPRSPRPPSNLREYSDAAGASVNPVRSLPSTSQARAPT
jgi:hypothetical protein